LLTIEECLEHLDEINWNPVPYCGNVLEITSNWDRCFISDVAYHTREGKALSTAQGKLALKLIDRYKKSLEIKGVVAVELEALLLNPIYKQEPHISVSAPREVRYAGDSKIVFRCRYNKPVVEDIKTLKNHSHIQHNSHPKYNGTNKIWLVHVDLSNVNKVIDVIRRHRFNFDDELAEFLTEVVNAKGQKSEITIEDNQIIIQCKDDELLSSWLLDLINFEDN
jgi:hypothetical protein